MYIATKNDFLFFLMVISSLVRNNESLVWLANYKSTWLRVCWDALMVKSSLSSKTVAFLKQQKLNNGLLVKQSKQVENASLISFAYSFVGRSNHYVYRLCFSRKRCIFIPGPCYQMVSSLDSISAIKSVQCPDTLLIDACEFKK